MRVAFWIDARNLNDILVTYSLANDTIRPVERQRKRATNGITCGIPRTAPALLKPFYARCVGEPFSEKIHLRSSFDEMLIACCYLLENEAKYKIGK